MDAMCMYFSVNALLNYIAHINSIKISPGTRKQAGKARCLDVRPYIHPSTHLFIYLHSSSSHLEHRVSVKRFVSLRFLNLRQLVGVLGRGISPS
jgi:hypothetical protein